MRKLGILGLVLTVCFTIGLGISVLAIALEETKIEWEYIKGGQGKAVIQGASFDEVWEETLDILMFGKFKMKGAPRRSDHEATTVQKDTGLIVIKGVVGGLGYKYLLKVVIREKGDYTEIKLNCTSAWKKEIIKEFFQLYEESLQGDKRV